MRTDLGDDVRRDLTTAGVMGHRVGEWALILGASSGIGAAVARRLAHDGMSILGVHLDTAARADDASELVEELEATGVSVHFVNANAASEQTRLRVLGDVTDIGVDRVGLLFHSLAFGTLLPYLPTPADESSETATLTSRQLTMTLEVMAHSLVWWTRVLLESSLLRQGSHVLAMTSAGDSRVSRSYGAVSAAKSALLAHVRQLAVEAAPWGVAVNGIRAGVTRTPSFDRIPGSERIGHLACGANPHGRLTTPEDVAEITATLLGTRSSWMTGNVISVDGGEGLAT